MKKFTLELRMIKSWLTGTSTENQNLKPWLHPFSLMSRYRASPTNSSMFNRILKAWQNINTITIQNRTNVFFTSLSLLRLSLPDKTFSGCDGRLWLNLFKDLYVLQLRKINIDTGTIAVNTMFDILIYHKM